jgi:hypothetical protein
MEALACPPSLLAARCSLLAARCSLPAVVLVALSSAGSAHARPENPTVYSSSVSGNSGSIIYDNNGWTFDKYGDPTITPSPGAGSFSRNNSYDARTQQTTFTWTALDWPSGTYTVTQPIYWKKGGSTCITWWTFTIVIP